MASPRAQSNDKLVNILNRRRSKSNNNNNNDKSDYSDSVESDSNDIQNGGGGGATAAVTTTKKSRKKHKLSKEEMNEKIERHDKTMEQINNLYVVIVTQNNELNTRLKIVEDCLKTQYDNNYGLGYHPSSTEEGDTFCGGGVAAFLVGSLFGK